MIFVPGGHFRRHLAPFGGGAEEGIDVRDIFEMEIGKIRGTDYIPEFEFDLVVGFDRFAVPDFLDPTCPDLMKYPGVENIWVLLGLEIRCASVVQCARRE